MSFSQILFLMIIALILFGPDDLPKIARAVGKAVFEIRKLANEFTREFQKSTSALNMDFSQADRKESSSIGSSTHTDTNSSLSQADQSKDEPKEELLKYEEAKLVIAEVQNDQPSNPLAELPPDMVSYEEKGASR